MCHCARLRDAWIAVETLFLDVPVRAFLEEKSVGMNRPSKEDPSSTNVRVQHPVSWGHWEDKKMSNGEFSLLELEHLFSPSLRHRKSWFLVPSNPSFDTMGPSVLRPLACLGNTSLVSLILRLSDSLELNYTTSFPGSPASKSHIVGLLNLFNCMSQFLK